MQGKIEFGVVSQSQSAFSHILSDVSLVVYQFESLAGFSAVVDRLGQFQEAIEAKGKLRLSGDAEYALDPESKIDFVDSDPASTLSRNLCSRAVTSETTASITGLRHRCACCWDWVRPAGDTLSVQGYFGSTLLKAARWTWHTEPA